MKSDMSLQTRFWKGLLIPGLLILLSACSQAPNKPQIDYSKFSQSQSAPLATELDVKDEYEFALDLARLQVERKRYAAAENLLQKLRRERDDDIRLYRLLGQVYEAQNKTEMARVARSSAVQLKDSSLDDESELARLYLMEGDYAAAESIYQNWVVGNAKSTQVSGLNNLGFSQLLQKRYAQAEGYFERALVIDPLNRKARDNLKLLNTLN
ncbi:tetratricopeptide repeat protein [Thiomicrorhabdus cannonii]|uniref:tetratricopeptide repeat protein n=1 Tax=Thiomicrorhabdus cannonii TaxID=2748011 RepID=UPI0015B79A45|nr:tetratricopeptide repeat protein [Thiomicrorhabdus cannonii]